MGAVDNMFYNSVLMGAAYTFYNSVSLGFKM